MKITFTFRHMDSSDALKEHTASKLERLSRFEDRELSIAVTFTTEKFHKSVEFQVTNASSTFVAGETRDDMYEAIDLAIDKLDRQLSRDKSKRKHHKGATPDEE